MCDHSLQDNCSHSFFYHSVIPPTHCPICGACLNCGAPAPWRPRPYRPYEPWVTSPTTVPMTPYYTGDPPPSQRPVVTC